MTSAEYTKRSCPYWCSMSHECQMVVGGLYLPMPEHIGLFCCSKSFVQCQQYILGCGIIRKTLEKQVAADSDNRRKFERIADEVPLHISLEGNDDLKGFLSASTLDMSLGGFRIETQNMIAPEEIVEFTFGNEFAVPHWKGAAKVCWTRKATNKESYESGMMITDNDTFHAIGQHIGFPGFPSAA